MDPLRPRIAAGAAAAACLLLAAPATVFAADKYGEDKPLDLPDEGPSRTAEIGGGGGSFMRTMIGLAVVVAVIYGVAWALRQMKRGKEERSSGFGLSSEAVIALGPNRSVHLIRAGRELVLVGSAEHGVVPIKTYSEDEARRLGLLPPQDDDDVVDGGAVVAGSTGAALVPARRRTVVDLLRERTVR
ncbi:flagellar biosynthetic protein FliO [Conexibacter sp. SYSU D00693]|uniref:FliO/MopB family protein n=1 Tax=Conexibacter sp. SYSU D00693 TaxID=2812560 RepID=UPI00196A65C5|nr:flagellar biosynthetic protein FliO [Conexibacter sp. SYSU D00693]